MSKKTRNSRKIVTIDGVDLILSKSDTIEGMEWIGNEVYLQQLLAAWMIIDPKHDMPMNPQILGKPGVGKTTLAYCAAKKLNRNVHIFQCTVDTRPEDLLITPVIGDKNTIKYHASPLVTAMIEGGVCILDEANRMAEKSWASLAPLLDQRRYIESIIAGIKVKAHPDFRVCVTMNEDTSTFEVPEYMHSRLQPQIFIEFPDREDEFEILKFNVPYAKDHLIAYITNYLQRAHRQNKPYTVRDGINICRYYLRMDAYAKGGRTNGDMIKKKGEHGEKKRGHGTKSSKELKESESSPHRMNLDLLGKAIKHVLGKEGYKVFRHRKDSRHRERPSRRERGSDFPRRRPKFKKKTEYRNDMFSSDSKDPKEAMKRFFDILDKEENHDKDKRNLSFRDEDIDELDEHFWDNEDFEFRSLNDEQKKKFRSFDDFEDLQKEFNIEIHEIDDQKKDKRKKDDYVKIIEEDKEKRENQKEKGEGERELKEGEEELGEEGEEMKNDLIQDFIEKQKEKKRRKDTEGQGKEETQGEEKTEEKKKSDNSSQKGAENDKNSAKDAKKGNE